MFTPFWRNAEKYYIEKIPSMEKKINKCKKKIDYFKNTIEPEKKYYQIKIGLKLLKKFGFPKNKAL